MGDGGFQKLVFRGVGIQQRFHFAAQFLVPGTGPVQKRRSLGGRKFGSLVEQVFDPTPPIIVQACLLRLSHEITP